jgi:thymidylate synthase (FAD)
MDSHAQFEIRAYAEVIGHEIVRRWCPMAWEAFLDYRVNAIELTRIDNDIIAAISSGDDARAMLLARSYDILPEEGEEMRRNMEREELEEKLRRLGMRIPWPVSTPSDEHSGQ